ncbi:hypothetical protein LEP1GSC026_4684 [Leptospira interrogans str. 2002000623]|uniref:Uncharacterized protein n=2 Tax=Leptospira interrogans TaxID=173 RepID=A0A829DAU2_LEPIR|nr:hypothetical protein LEP1GSC027_4190 [Leptospira interrogans str. 2002000624]EKQ36284.1 hypothetical protein LEP1GSC025_0775 [Leptospira interrogans str. 2002000621]EKQ47589.1 hypothetical protein LEP1GSC026_4684 [Leptospira interrogans str. 2002000623]EMY05356.1 hypothetical protein LEP1GSC029_3376 [Leptospira interrogans str. 2002000626]EMY22789.1 hypothetical protein LEP1GSC115_2936 [Leptospira interrogans serovar Australis str. 200703203]
MLCWISETRTLQRNAAFSGVNTTGSAGTVIAGSGNWSRCSVPFPRSITCVAISERLF